MGIPPVFKKENALPCPELQFAVANRNDFTRPGQNHPNVGRHVVWAFVIVLVAPVFRHEIIDKSLQITAGRRGCVFHQQQTAARVPNKNGGRALSNARGLQNSCGLGSNLIRALAAGLHFDLTRMDAHLATNLTSDLVSTTGIAAPLLGG